MSGLQQADDRELVERFTRLGDEEAFRVLFRRHTPRLHATALRLMAGRAADAEDVVQDAWLRAAGRLRSFEWRSALSTWLTAIVINCARERLRRPIREAPLADGTDVPNPTRSAPHSAMDLDRAISALPDGYREVLVLHDVEGYTHQEIAALLDLAVGTSKSQLFHARRSMRAAMKEIRDGRTRS